MVSLNKYVSLRPNVRHVLFFHHGALSQDFHGVDMPRITFLYQSHFAERTAANHLEGIEVVDAEPRALQSEELGLLDGVLLTLFGALLLRNFLVLQRFF